MIWMAPTKVSGDRPMSWLSSCTLAPSRSPSVTVPLRTARPVLKLICPLTTAVNDPAVDLDGGAEVLRVANDAAVEEPHLEPSATVDGALVVAGPSLSLLELEHDRPLRGGHRR